MAARQVNRGPVLVDPVEELFPHRLVVGIRPGIGIQLAEAYLGQRHVVHFGGTPIDPLMFAVALPTTTHVGMERSRLALQDGLVIGMAGDAVGGLNALDGGVTGRAIVFQKRVGS